MFTSKNFFSLVGAVLVFSASAFYIASNGFVNSPDAGAIVQTQEKYSLVRVLAVNENDFRRMAEAGLLIDHAVRKPGQYLDAWLSASEIELLRNSGVPYQILIDDWQKYYDSQPKMTEGEIQRALQEAYERDNITHSIYGSMGGYLKFNEVVAKMDSMRLEYPNFISQKFSLGNSYENRPIWCARVTLGPNAPTGRPEVMFHSLIHAREPISMEAQVYFMYWLFENYGIDPIATYILRFREIYWIPVFNPDGYVYNETTNPNGGGMWRKNRKPCSGGTGADLNRNYGTYQFWNSTNGGSSTSCGSDTYRGTLPFSEPETQALFTFVNSRNFKTSISAHTYGNYLIKPWGWIDPTPTPDDNIFNTFLQDCRASNGYTVGTASQTVGYFVRGVTDDWYYNDSGHAKIIAITPETGTSFWPSQAQIIPLAQSMLFTYQYFALVAGPYVNPTSMNFNQPFYAPGQSGYFRVRFRNKGLMAAQNVRVTLTPSNSYITIPTQQYTYPSLASFASDSATFNFTISASAPNNCAIRSTLAIKLDTNTIYTTSVYAMVGTGTLTLADSAENGFSRWTTNGTWGITSSTYHSPSNSFTDSPGGNYGNNQNTYMVLANPINISSYPVTYLSFWHRYATEAGYDFCYVEVSSDNGTTWQTVTSYNGTLATWTQQTFDITSYANSSSQLRIRFRLQTDASVVADGWYVDDIKITNYCLTPVGISGNESGLPNRFALQQNYPNPFNPATVIKYQLPKQEYVSIKVFDILGKEVASLVNENKAAGYYEVEFDGSNFASGLYFYRIEAGDFKDTKKMMLVK